MALLQQPPLDRQFLLVAEVMKRLRISRSTLYEYLAEDGLYYKPDFPKPSKLGRRNVFDKDEIDAYMDSVMLAREVLPRR